MIFDELTPVGLFPGETAEGASQWPPSVPRREEVVRILGERLYGVTPGGGQIGDAELLSDVRYATHRSREYRLLVNGPGGSLPVYVLCQTPLVSDKAAPVFVSLNFKGNHAMIPEEQLHVSNIRRPRPAREFTAAPPYRRGTTPFIDRGWDEMPITERGDEISRWPVESVVGEGFALISAFYGDFEVDAPGFGSEGVRGLFSPDPDRQDRSPESWGAIGAWAWGYSRLLDFIGQVPTLDSSRVFAIGHSRLGKAALWSVAQDERFAGCVSNNSGCGGAAIFRGKDGEDIRCIVEGFPHWFAPALAEYIDLESELPFDQHWLISSILPRSVMIGSADEDLWADPCNEFAAVLLARLVSKGLAVPGASGNDCGSGKLFLERCREACSDRSPNSVDFGQPAHWLRRGGHDVTVEDWRAYVSWAKKELLQTA